MTRLTLSLGLAVGLMFSGFASASLVEDFSSDNSSEFQTLSLGLFTGSGVFYRDDTHTANPESMEIAAWGRNGPENASDGWFGWELSGTPIDFTVLDTVTVELRTHTASTLDLVRVAFYEGNTNVGFVDFTVGNTFQTFDLTPALNGDEDAVDDIRFMLRRKPNQGSDSVNAYIDNFEAVPEPASAVLMLIGGGLMLRRRR